MSYETINLIDVSKTFDDTLVLDNINLYIRRNEFLTLLGPSGCGKTTTLRIIGGFEEPTTGKVLFEGKDITHVPPYKRKVNTVFQRYALFPHMNVEENVALALTLKNKQKYNRRKGQEHARSGKSRGFEKRTVDSLSGVNSRG